MSKWPNRTRFFEFQVDKKGVVEELIADGDIETLCGSITQRRYCIVTDGCAPTLAALKPFAPDMFEEDEIAWWLREISEEDANASYAMDKLCGKVPVFTKEDNELVQSGPIRMNFPTSHCFFSTNSLHPRRLQAGSP